MSTSLHQPQGDLAAAQTVPPSNRTKGDTLPAELREHVRRLRLILPVISVSVMALHRQDAAADADIASVLSQHACEPLDGEFDLKPRLERGFVCLNCQMSSMQAASEDCRSAVQPGFFSV